MSASAVPEPSADPNLSPRGRRSFARAAARTAALLVGVLLTLVVGASPALAHAELLRSDPADGATLASGPRVIRLWFSEEISQGISHLRLAGADGHTVASTRPVAQDDPHLLEVAVPPLGQGGYAVLWQVRAQDDGHTTSGTVVFSVGAAPTAFERGDATSDSPAPFDVALRWLRICVLAGLVGGLAVVGLVLPRAGAPDPPEPLVLATRTARDRVLAVAAGCAAFGLLVGIVEIAPLQAEGRSFASTAGELLGRTRWGHLWSAAEAGLLALLIVLVALRRAPAASRRGRVLMAAAVGGTLALVWFEALVSHAAAVETGHNPAVVADAVHILAACVWLGAVPTLLVVLWPSPAGETGGLTLVRACGGAFTKLVAASVGVVVVTGLFSAGVEVESAGDLVGTSYGRTLLVKVGLLALLLSLGAANSSRLHGRSPWGPLARRTSAPRPLGRRLVAVEAGVGALLLVTVGLLVETPPALGQPAAGPAPAVKTRSGSVADLVVTISATPNRPGLNGFTVITASTRRPPPAAVDSAQLELTVGGRASVLVLQRIGPDRWFGTTELEAPGAVRIDALVRRAGALLRVPVVWQVNPALGPPPPPAVPSHPLAPYADGLALALVVAAAVGGAVYVSRRRTSPPSSATPAEQPAERHVPV